MGLRSLVNTHGADAKPKAMKVNGQIFPTNETVKHVGLTH
jgi:hypothetical protein